MSFVRGTLVGDLLPYNSVKSINSLYLGEVLLDDATKPCLLKNIPRVEILNELIAAGLARTLGLPIPDTVLVFVPDELNLDKLFAKCPRITGGRIVFATVEVQTPNLSQRLNSAHFLEKSIIVHHLLIWDKKSDLYGFDTWVANTDRHRGNILLSPLGQVWLIDHGRCFTRDDWTPPDLEPGNVYPNRLREWYTILMDPSVRHETRSKLPIVEKTIMGIDIDAVLSPIFGVGFALDDEKRAIVNFLAQRVSRVAADASLAL